MLTFLTGTHASARRAYLAAAMAADVQNGKHAVLLVPEQANFERDRALLLQFGAAETLQVETVPVEPLLVDRGAGANIAVRVERPETVEAPVEKGQSLGSASFFAGEAEIARYPILAAESAGRLTLWDAVYRILCAVRQP